MLENLIEIKDNEQIIYSVTDLNRQARLLLETEFPYIHVSGEISNLARPASGHMYFTLKDEKAQIKCAMFRHANQKLDFEIESGMQVTVGAKLSLYEGRGDYQLIVTTMEPAGDGLLRRQFEELTKKLKDEGLFDQQHKKPIPEFVKTLGVITSPSGAAITDIISTLKRRNPSLPIVIYPSMVQGDKAVNTLIKSIELANIRSEVDTIIIARGGGSLEDLFCFNDERLARAIFKSEIPILSAIGHEVDFTIADFVADLRAATPTAAAELVSTDRNEWLNLLTHKTRELISMVNHMINDAHRKFLIIQQKLIDPKHLITESIQKVDNIEARLTHSMHNTLFENQKLISQLSATLHQANPKHSIRVYFDQSVALSKRFMSGMEKTLQVKENNLALLGASLHGASPLEQLKRGYAIIEEKDSKKLIKSTKNIKIGDFISSTVADGKILSTVTKVNPH